MDPLSVATSIAGLIVAACQVSSFLKDSVVGYLGRPENGLRFRILFIDCIWSC